MSAAWLHATVELDLFQLLVVFFPFFVELFELLFKVDYGILDPLLALVSLVFFLNAIDFVF
jgi:hypothetical protein